ncbi:MAG: ArsA-related P-loop ATPase [Candidatus Binataceae bacterium]
MRTDDEIAPPATIALIDRLLAHRLLIIIGKGGAGRSSISAALALIAAGRGSRVLLIEADLRTPVAAAYGKHPGFEPAELRPNLFAMALRGQESLEEYLSFVVPRPILRAVFATAVYQYFVQAAPAVRELTMMGKVYHEIERRAAPPWDLVIFDAPASGQALSMIQMPFVARETFGSGMAGSEASAIGRLLGNEAKCAIVAVTTTESLAIAETLECHRSLKQLELKLAATFFNRTSSAAFDGADITRMAALPGASRELDDLIYLARAELKRRTRERRAQGVLRRTLGCPVIAVSEHCGLADADLFDALAAQLTA